MKKYFIYICSLIACAAGFSACSNDDGGGVTVKNVYSTGCKTGETVNSSSPKTRSYFDEMGFEEYVEYTSKSNGYVYVTHHNVLFSCCNDSIGVDLLQDENRIIVVEREAFNCNCICPFDVSFEIGPFIPGSYNTITIRKRFNLSEEGTGETYGSFSFKYPSSGKTRIKYEYE